MPTIFKKIMNSSPGIVLAYILLALFFTFPLIMHITDSIAAGRNPIDNQYIIDSDGLYFMTSLWFFKNNLIDLRVSPFGTSDMIFYPGGFNMAATGYDNLLNSVLSLPLQLISDNLFLTYNILVLFNFVFAAYTAYVLIEYLTGNRKISFVAGIIFGFSPYMVARSLAHFNLMTTGAIPLFVLFFIKMIKEKKYANSVLLAASFFLVSISSWQYGLFTVLFAALSLIFFSIYQRSDIFNKEFGKRFILFALLAGLMILPVILPAARSYAGQDMTPQSSSELLLYSASILGFFVPSPLSTFIGQFVDPNYFKSFSTNIVEGTVFLGFLEFLIIIFYAQKAKKIAPAGKYWLFMLIIFFILSLGSFLKISLYGLFFDWLHMPYYFIFTYIPFFNLAKEAVRLDVFIMLFAAIIFALTIKYIFSEHNLALHKQKMILLGFAAIVIFERMILPYPIDKIKAPSFYYEIAKDKENYAIMDLPINSTTGAQFSFYTYYQTIHKKKITSGKIVPNAFSDKTTSFIDESDFLKNGACLAEVSREKEPEDVKIDRERSIKRLKDNNIRYVIIHKDIMEYLNTHYVMDSRNIVFDCQELGKDIQELFAGANPVFEDELIKVYDIGKTT